MDLEKIVLFLIVVVIAYFVIKNIKGILVSIITVCITLFVALFVLTDILHFPVDNYVDISEVDRFRIEGLNYVEDKLDEIESEENDNTTEDDLFNDEFYFNNNDQKVNKFELDKLEYEEINRETKMDFIKRNIVFVEDERFPEKVMGMNRFVNVEYDLGNAILKNSEDGKYIVLKYK